MKVLDPQSALLTTTEVHHFLRTNPVRPPDKAVGGHPTVDLLGYYNIREDFERYTQTISPHILTYAPPETWMSPVLTRLKALGLTKAEALMVINLGVGLGQPIQKLNRVTELSNADESTVLTTTNGTVSNDEDDEHEENGQHEDMQSEQVVEEAEAERDDSLTLNVVIEELESRMSESQQQEILNILRKYAVESEDVLGGGLEEDVMEATTPD